LGWERFGPLSGYAPRLLAELSLLGPGLVIFRGGTCENARESVDIWRQEHL